MQDFCAVGLPPSWGDRLRGVSEPLTLARNACAQNSGRSCMFHDPLQGPGSGASSASLCAWNPQIGGGADSLTKGLSPPPHRLLARLCTWKQRCTWLSGGLWEGTSDRCACRNQILLLLKTYNVFWCVLFHLWQI